MGHYGPGGWPSDTSNGASLCRVPPLSYLISASGPCTSSTSRARCCMLFLSGLGSPVPLLPEVPSRNRVPRAPSNRVPRGWDGRVPSVPPANLVPRRNIRQRMLVAYPTFEPTFPPPQSVRADWEPPQMQMVNGLSGGMGWVGGVGRGTAGDGGGRRGSPSRCEGSEATRDEGPIRMRSSAARRSGYVPGPKKPRPPRDLLIGT